MDLILVLIFLERIGYICVMFYNLTNLIIFIGKRKKIKNYPLRILI